MIVGEQIALSYLRYIRKCEFTQLNLLLLTEDADPDRVASEIDSKLRAGVVATKTRHKGAFQASTLSDTAHRRYTGCRRAKGVNRAGRARRQKRDTGNGETVANAYRSSE